MSDPRSESSEVGEDESRAIGIHELLPEEREAAVDLIRQTIATSWHGVRPPQLICYFQEKYTPESLAKRQETTTLWVARDDSRERT